MVCIGCDGESFLKLRPLAGVCQRRLQTSRQFQRQRMELTRNPSGPGLDPQLGWTTFQNFYDLGFDLTSRTARTKRMVEAAKEWSWDRQTVL